MDLSGILDWIRNYQDVLTWAGGGVATGASGLWLAVRQFSGRADKKSSEDAAASRSTSRVASAGVGVAGGRDVRIGGGVTIHQSNVPKAAIGLAALGVLLLGYAAFSGVSVRNGSYVGGDVTNSRIEVNAPAR